MLKTIKSTLTLLNCVAIAIVSLAALAFSINEHERLYKSAVAQELSGLSSNVANDLVVPLAGDERDFFGLTTTLLRLDKYRNVKYAVVFDNNGAIIHSYVGTASPSLDTKMPLAVDVSKFEFGTIVKGHDIIAFERIGDKAFPLGKLLIVNDLHGPLSESKADLLMSVLPLTIAVIVSTALIFFWLNNRLMLPFGKLAYLAKKIKSTNDYSISVEVEGKKEVNVLSQEFSSMMSTIHQEEIKNKAYTKRIDKQRQQMEKLANFDDLTGLANRQFFMHKIKKSLFDAKQQQACLAILYIDLDGFKAVNDMHGHHIGDKLLVQATKRMLSFVKDPSSFCRFGGDEFLLLVEKDTDIGALNKLAYDIIHRLQNVFTIDQWEIEIGASIGITYACDAEYSVEKFISNADTAMYEAKANGRSNAILFNENMLAKHLRRLAIANALPIALKSNGLELFYQAKVDKHEKVKGFEGLIRWNDKELGFVSPNEFIEIAEKSGKITQISYFVIEQACRDLSLILQHYGNDVVVSINLSSHDLKQPELAGKIQSLFSRYEVNPKNIEFEVTESAYLENFEQANSFFDEVSEMGCSIALDDFGTGYSSLSYLTRINIDTLKIDKEFVDNYGIEKKDTMVTQSIIHLAQKLNLNICAEGVETHEQKEMLLAEGCHLLQGYLFSKPLPLHIMLTDIEQKNTFEKLNVSNA